MRPCPTLPLRQLRNGLVFKTTLLLQATPTCRWSKAAAPARSTSEVWTMCPCTARQWSRPRPRRTRSRASYGTNCRHSSSPPTTSSPWNSSALRKRWWRSAYGKRRQGIGWYIRAVVSGESASNNFLWLIETNWVDLCIIKYFIRIPNLAAKVVIFFCF